MRRSRLWRIPAFTIGGLVLVAILLVGAIIVRLQFGPLSLEAIGPRIVALVQSEAPDHEISFGDLTLATGVGLIKLQATDVAVVSRDKTFTAKAPTVDLSVGLFSLLQGAPEIVALRIARPDIQLAVTEDATGSVDPSPLTANEVINQLSESLTDATEFTSVVPESLNKVEVEQGRLSAASASSDVIAIENMNIALRRQRAQLIADADFDLGASGNPATFDARLAYRQQTETLEAKVSFNSLNAPDLPVLADLADVLDTSVSGNAELNVELREPNLDGSVEITAGPGTLTLPDLPAPIELASAELRAAIPDIRTLEIETAELVIVSPGDTADPEQAAQETSSEPAGKTSVSLKGRLAAGETDLAGDVTISIADLVLTEMTDLWPTEVSPDERAWVAENVRDGVIEAGEIQVALTAPDGAVDALEVEKLEGSLTYRNLDVAYVDAPPGGDASVSMDIDGESVSGLFEVGLGEGVLSHPVLADPIRFGSAQVRGSITGSSSLEIETAEVVLLGRADQESPDTSEQDQTTLTAGGRVTTDEDGLTANVELGLKALPVLDLVTYWPLPVSPGGLEWISENMRDGFIEAGSFEIALTAPGGAVDALEPTELTGSFSYRDLELTYMEEPPPITGLTGSAKLEYDQLIFEATGGASAGLVVESATVGLHELFADLPTLSVNGTISGPLDAAATLYGQLTPDEDQLPEIAGGEIILQLDVGLPLLDDLPFDEVDIATEGNIVDATLTELTPTLDATNGNFDIAITPDRATLAGGADLAGVPILISFEQTFSTGDKPGSRLSGSVPTFGPELLQALGIDATPVLDGTASAQFDVELNLDGDGTAVVDLGLQDTLLSLQELAWQKLQGKPGEAHVVVSLNDWSVVGLDTITVDAGDLHAEGRVSLSETGEIEQADVIRLALGRTQVNDLQIIPKGEGLRLTVGSGTVDVGPLLGDERDAAADTPPDLQTASAPPEDQASSDLEEAPQPVEIRTTVPLERVYVGESGFLTDVQLEFRQTERGLELVEFEGHLPQTEGTTAQTDSAPAETREEKTETNAVSAEEEEPQGLLTARFAPTPEGPYELEITSDDAGGTLRALGILDEVEGGALTIIGATEDSDPASPIDATIEVRDFRVVDAPTIARILTLASIPGAINLTKSGLTFQRLSGQLRIIDGEVIELVEVRANASQLGMSAAGTIDIGNEQLDVSGVTVPARYINALPAKIPLIGLILGGRDREGIFAVPYAVQGPFDDPEVTVRGRSALTPGILRDVFGQASAD